MVERALLSAMLLLAGCGKKPELADCEPDPRGPGADVSSPRGHVDGCLVREDLSLPLRFEPGGEVAVDLVPALLELPLDRLKGELGLGPTEVALSVPIVVDDTELKLRTKLPSDGIPWSGLLDRWPASSSGEATIVLQEGIAASPKIIGEAATLADATTLVVARHVKRPALDCGPYVNTPLDGSGTPGSAVPRKLELTGSALEVTVVRAGQGRVASRTFEPACPEASYVMTSERDSVALSTSTPPIEQVLDWVAAL